MMPRRPLRRLAAVVALALLTTVVGPLPSVAPAGAADPTTKTPVMGPNVLTAEQLAAWYNKKRGGAPPRAPGVGNDITTLARLFIEEGRADGVRGDIAFVQSVLETGWFSFPDYGQIRPWFNNFAGIRAYNGRPPGTTCEAETAPSRCFESARIGIRHQIHLLRGYADATTRNMRGRLLSPPSDRIGAAPYWELFGGASGIAIWATDPGYGLKIVKLYSDALVSSGVRAACFPYSPETVANPSGNGYWVVTDDGSTFSFGTARFYGGMNGKRLNAPIVGAESTSTGKGYWQLGGDGGIFSFGDARFYGSTGAMRLNQPVHGMERTRANAGYWLVAYDGGIFSFGDARFHGSTGAMRLNQPVVGMERTRSGDGYWLVAKDGGIFAFGDAEFYGSLGDRSISSPIVGMQRTRSGKGYWMLAANGRVYAFGDAKHYGHIAGCTNYGKAVRMLTSPSGKGYWIATEEGSVISFGDARRLGMPSFTSGPTVALMLRP